jgi:dinuclear metal center YbgI/SA1388 family protein
VQSIDLYKVYQFVLNMVTLSEITSFTEQFLNTSLFNDYCPNGLQIEVKQGIEKIVTAVTASQAAIEAAAEAGADLLLVHHGYFWKNETQTLTGMKGRRIRMLYENGINLAAWHLPLDAHPEIGNNAQLAKRLRWENARPVEEGGLLWQVELPEAVTACTLTQQLEGALGRQPQHIAGGPIQFNKVGWCTGAAQSYIEQAADLGLHAFISGEISENTTHAARELGIHYFAAGHHATERYGIQALGCLLSEKFDIAHQFVEISNPV